MIPLVLCSSGTRMVRQDAQQRPNRKIRHITLDVRMSRNYAMFLIGLLYIKAGGQDTVRIADNAIALTCGADTAEKAGSSKH